MTKEEDFLNIESSRESPLENKDEKAGLAANSTYPSSSPSSKHQIIERKIFTVTTFRVYPNGTMFIVKTQSWFDKQQPAVRKKVKKKLEVKKAELTKSEEY